MARGAPGDGKKFLIHLKDAARRSAKGLGT